MSEAGGELPAFGRDLGNEVNPMWLLRTLPNNVLCHVGIKYELKGSNACITNHSAGGTLAVIEAAEALRQGEADRAIAIGHDAPIEPQMVLYYHQCGCSRPTPSAHSTCGAAAAYSARARARSRSKPRTLRKSATPSRWVRCSAAAMQPKARDYSRFATTAMAFARAITQALAEAGLAPADIGMIVAHGNGTPLSDASEAAALRERVWHRRRGSAGHGIQVGDRASDRRGRHHGDGDRAGGAARAHRPGHRHAGLARS